MLKLIFVSCLVGLGLMAGCELSFCFEPQPDYQYTTIEVTYAASGEAVVDAEIRVQLDSSAFGINDRMTPTDSQGQTLVLLSIVGCELILGIEFTLDVQLPEMTETLELTNIEGATAEGQLFSVRVVDTDVPGPPTPLVRAILGSNPPEIYVQGYVSGAGACSQETGGRTWDPHINQAWTDQTFTVRTLEDTQGSSVSSTCRTMLEDAPEHSFRAYTRTRFVSELVVTEPFCLDSDGTLVACDE